MGKKRTGKKRVGKSRNQAKLEEALLELLELRIEVSKLQRKGRLERLIQEGQRANEVISILQKVRKKQPGLYRIIRVACSSCTRDSFKPLPETSARLLKRGITEHDLGLLKVRLWVNRNPLPKDTPADLTLS